ncbi:hypothetical protein AYO44_17685, partial [Planctomycetaceae bacterium SCGC AG-212-F19]
GKVSDRKLRLFAVACCQQIWDRVTDERSRTSVAVAERFADGLATPTELLRACHAAFDVSTALAGTGGATWAAASACASTSHPDIALRIRGNGGIAWTAAYRAKSGPRLRQCELLRDIVANPFRPVTVDPIWLTSNVAALAKRFYDERAFDSLPILADALEDAGCTNADVLGHCRVDGVHVRGCWLIDLLLQKE